MGVASQGETVEEAEANLKEACELYLESAKELGIVDKILEKVDVRIKRIKGLDYDEYYLCWPVSVT